jgi:hypothetical protein
VGWLRTWGRSWDWAGVSLWEALKTGAAPAEEFRIGSCVCFPRMIVIRRHQNILLGYFCFGPKEESGPGFNLSSYLNSYETESLRFFPYKLGVLPILRFLFLFFIYFFIFWVIFII